MREGSEDRQSPCGSEVLENTPKEETGGVGSGRVSLPGFDVVLIHLKPEKLGLELQSLGGILVGFLRVQVLSFGSGEFC